MPLSDEQKAALKTLAAVPAADAEELAREFRSAHAQATQLIYDDGHGAGVKSKGSEVRKLEKDVEKLTGEKTKLEQQLAERDPEKVHEKYKTEIAELTTKHEGELKAARAQTLEVRRQADLNALRARLADKLTPIALKAVLNDPETATRLAYGEDDKGQTTRRVLQLGKDIEYATPAGKDPLELLAADLVERVKTEDPSAVRAGGESGAGVQQGGGSGGYDPVKVGKEMAQSQKQQAGDGSLAFK